MHQPEVFVGRHISQCGSTQPVHAIGLGRFRLGPVNRRISRAVDDAAGGMAPHQPCPRCGGTDVSLLPPDKDEPPVRIFARHAAQRLSELSAGTCHKNRSLPFHKRTQ